MPINDEHSKKGMTAIFSLFELGKYQKAFEHLGNALTFDPNNYKVCGYLHITIRQKLILLLTSLRTVHQVPFKSVHSLSDVTA